MSSTQVCKLSRYAGDSQLSWVLVSPSLYVSQEWFRRWEAGNHLSGKQGMGPGGPG